MNREAPFQGRSLLEILAVDKAVEYTAERLREQAESSQWGTQEAVAKWLGILADDLDECVAELRRTPRS